MYKNTGKPLDNYIENAIKKYPCENYNFATEKEKFREIIYKKKYNFSHEDFRETQIKNRSVYICDDRDKKVLISIAAKYLTYKKYGTPPNRNIILSEVTQAIKETPWKKVYKIDISNFYENIDPLKLKNIVIPRINRKEVAELVEQIIDSFDENGVLQGISISNVLAEYYGNTIVRKLENRFDNITIYRYIDDFLIFYYPNNEIYNSKNITLEDIDKIFKNFNLEINESKSREYERINFNKLTYLGIEFYSEENNIRSCIPETKILEYFSKINEIIEQYEKSIAQYKVDEDKKKLKMADALFYARIKYYCSIRMFSSSDALYETGIFALVKKTDSYEIEKSAEITNNINAVIGKRIGQCRDFIPSYTIKNGENFQEETANFFVERVCAGFPRKMIFINKNSYMNDKRLRKKFFNISRSYIPSHYKYVSVVNEYIKLLK